MSQTKQISRYYYKHRNLILDILQGVININANSKLKEDLDKYFSEATEEDLENVIDLYGQKIFNYCFNILCNYYDAQDASQTVFIKAWSKRRQYKSNTSLQSWLYKIAYRCCIDHIRKRKDILHFEDSKEVVPFKEPDILSEGILHAFTLLTVKERAVVYGRIIEELTYEELSKIYKTSESTLRKRYERGRKKLMNSLNDTVLSQGRII